jgi:predicted dehydrogenase
METEDHVFALLETAAGKPVNLVATTACYPGNTELIEIIGSRGTSRLIGKTLEIDRPGMLPERIEGRLKSGRRWISPPQLTWRCGPIFSMRLKKCAIR